MAIAIKEEASPEVERAAARCHWISLGELSRLIEICKQEGITQIMMAGPGEAREDFFLHSSGLAAGEAAGSAGRMKNTDSLIGGVCKGAGR